MIKIIFNACVYDVSWKIYARIFYKIVVKRAFDIVVIYKLVLGTISKNNKMLRLVSIKKF